MKEGDEQQGGPQSPPSSVGVDGAAVDSAMPSSDLKGSRKLPGTVNWGTATIVGVFAGLLYGGSKEASASVSKDAEVMLKLGSTPDKREQYRIMRDAMEKRFIRVARGSFVGGVRLGMFTAAFYGLQNLLAEKRGVHDVYNVAGAGSATAAMFGLIMPGSLMWRARNVLLGSVLGAGICFPLGWVHLKLMEKANEERLNSKPSDLDEEETNRSRVGAAIERLEGNLRR
ncbi:Tim17/Tim22/Tim23/Pmp24 family [Musa troglodytarum]|uniref:Complex I assembly factor TIMMDC1, mitochondrial n=1 Tax=Musa troglodytarum TaxID=320322 RepID=A0A9E7GSS3_9LILI|nr:Tim17/Tim22/Tim23/Pmp24 family [Musa troglodytarum]URE16624.1 Tim17/Tim22/Tim23/Pmp24 family [Musa troglodytarum]